MNVCAWPGCPSLVPRGSYCDPHRLAKRKDSDAKRPSARQRGYGARWEHTRTAYLRGLGNCEDAEGCISTPTEVHHLDGLGPNGPRGHDPDNLQGLCKHHHSRITAKEQPGGWHGQ